MTSVICQIDVSLVPLGEFSLWQSDAKGVIYAKSAYKYLHCQVGLSIGQEEGWWCCLWRLPVLPRINGFCWKLLHRRLPMSDRLARLVVCNAALYPFCLLESESISRSFFLCNFAAD